MYVAQSWSKERREGVIDHCGVGGIELCTYLKQNHVLLFLLPPPPH